MEKGRLIIIFLTAILLKTSGSYAQENKIISGRVTTFNEISLHKVKITATKSGQHTYSDTLGYFSINCSEEDVLRFSAKGFDGEKIKVRKWNQSTVDLIYSNNDDSFADAIKYGHISRELLEMAINEYPLKGDVDYSNYSSIYDLIDDKIHNVTVSGNSVRTNKPSSFSASQEVLYVVNGIITADISFVVPSNVKTITYVDGPGASIYGARGANGAIEITLK